MERLLIGRKDKASLPLFGLNKVPIKIDTGAYTSSIHCDHIEKVMDGDNEVLKVEFFSHENIPAPIQIFDTFSEKVVKSSTGQPENRYVIKGDIILFGKKYSTNFSLTERRNMRYPILLGRKLLNRRFVVDSSKTNLSVLNKKTTVFIR
jgi:hypothetical protein